MAITTVIPNYSVIPQRSDPANFSAYRDIWLVEEQLRITNTNDVADEMNSTAIQVNTDAGDAAISASESLTYSNNSSNSAAQAAIDEASATAAATAIQGYVIPTTATYALADIDTKMSSRFTSSGTISKQDDSNVFETVVGNEYKISNTDRFVNLDGNVLNFPTGTEVDLTNYIPEVIVQDQATNGLVVQSSVNAGDYVVIDKEELVINGTFDTDSDWTKGTGWTIGAGLLTSAGGNTNEMARPIASQGLTIGLDYTYTFEITSITGTLAIYEYNGTFALLGSFTTTGVKRINFNSIKGYSVVFYSNTFTGSVDNVSLELAKDIYRATEDIPTLTSLTDSRFEDRTQIGITNQIATTTLSDGTTYSEVFFSDCYATETVNDMWSKNNWSKLSNGLYSKDGMVGTPNGIWQTENLGRHSEFFNVLGRYEDTDGKGIDATAFPITSTADAFTNIGTTLAFADYNPQFIRKDNWINCQIEANKANPVELLSEATTKAVSGGLDGISGIVFTEQVLQVAETTATLAVTDNTLYPAGSVLQIWDGTTAYRRTVVSNSTNPITLNATIIKTAVLFNISGGQLPIISSVTSLKTNLIGSPAVYAQSIKDILASGKYLVGIKTLITDETGASLIPDGILDTFKVSDKFTTMYSNIRSTDSGVTYTAFTPTSSQTTNALTLTNEPTANFVLAQYTAKNPTTTQCDPMEVKTVGTYAVGSNSHSVHKGNMLIDGKVQVGNGVNGLESRGLENANVTATNGFNSAVKHGVNSKAYYIRTYINSLELLPNSTFNIGNSTVHTGNIGYIQLMSGATYIVSSISYVDATRTIINLNSSEGDLTALDFTDSRVILGGDFQLTPDHNPITLDNSDSSAYKHLLTIGKDSDGMAHLQVFSQEIVSNVGAYDGDDNEFTQLTNGTLIDDNGNTIITKVSSRPLNIYL